MLSPLNCRTVQIRQAFKLGEITPELANKIGYELGMSFTKGNHAFIVATHIDKAHIHNHIIFNSTSLDCTKKFQDFERSTEINFEKKGKVRYNRRMKNKEKLRINEYFAEVELTEEYEPYFCSVGDAITIVIVGTFCGFRNLRQIQQWAAHEKIKELLKEYFGVAHVPCYYWLTCLLKIIEPKSMNQCFTNWILSLLPEIMEGKTVSFDGKTICSKEKMNCFEQSLHIVRAQIAELGLTFGQEAVERKSNEIPAMQRLIKTLRLKVGRMAFLYIK